LNKIKTNKKKNDNKDDIKQNNYNKLFINYEYDNNDNNNNGNCFPLNNNKKRNNEIYFSSIFNEIGKNNIEQYKNYENNDKMKNESINTNNNGFSLFN